MARLLLLFFVVIRMAAQGPIVLLSFDGFGSDRFEARTTPRLWALARAGWQGRGIPPFPSTTFNGHATLATGCGPERHGIVGNAFRDPRAGFVPHAASPQWLQAEPLWVAATRAGRRVALWHWPCGEGPWNDVRPWRLEPYRPDRTDAEALTFAQEALAEGADLVMVYLRGVDAESHRYGPASPQADAQREALDRLVAPWIEAQRALHPSLRIWLVADHGMARTHRRMHLPSLLKGIPFQGVTHGGSATLYLEKTEDRPTALRRLRSTGLTVWLREELPAAFRLRHSDRVGDVVVLAPTGTWLGMARTALEDRRERSGRRGAHGYRGEDPGMPALLVLVGAGQGTLGDIPLWDIAPTLAHWLGISWESPRDGRPIPALVTPTSTGPEPGGS